MTTTAIYLNVYQIIVGRANEDTITLYEACTHRKNIFLFANGKPYKQAYNARFVDVQLCDTWYQHVCIDTGLNPTRRVKTTPER